MSSDNYDQARMRAVGGDSGLKLIVRGMAVEFGGDALRRAVLNMPEVRRLPREPRSEEDVVPYCCAFCGTRGEYMYVAGHTAHICEPCITAASRAVTKRHYEDAGY